MWYLRQTVEMVLILLIDLPLHAISSFVSMFLKLLARSGVLQSVRSRRMLVRVLRAVPFRQHYRSDARMRRLRDKPFAIDLHTAAPSSLIGLKIGEISSLLGREVHDICMLDHGKCIATWTNYSSAEVKCFFEREQGPCVSCSFQVKPKRGRWEVVSRAP